jgi:predicted ATPase/class 3 adenylate cyclase/tetratricopeptide (TPR) repeat protein
MSGHVLSPAAPVHRFILQTDIAQSSRLAEQYGRKYLHALGIHNQLVEQTVERHGGEIYKQTGDGYLVLFDTARVCLEAALELGEALGRLEPLAQDEQVLVRLVLHAGELQPTGQEYFGPALNRVSRICQVCHPGQVLISGTIASYFRGGGGSARDQQGDEPAQSSLFQLRDLGLHHLRDLAEPEQLYQLVSERFARFDFPPLATLENRPNNLVRQPNHFIGREQELKELAGLLLGDTYLLSIVAPGGYGKSRLAAQLCANLLHRFEQGVFIVYLAPVRDSLDVPTAIATALGYQFSGGRTPEQQLGDYLRAKDLLLCLDNFEHLPDCAPLVSQLLSMAPSLKIVVTSREALRVESEYIYPLEPLPVTVAAGEHYSEAAKLFADRALLVNHGFALTDDNAAQIEHFCGHMEGIPLAIELAAAWMDGFTLEELHYELTSQLELESRLSGKPARHHSLKACLDWSWNLLGAGQQEMLMCLSTFRGGISSEAASAVLGKKGMALRAAVLKLCDKSWLYTREVDGQTRFYLRDMLAHEYAIARLEETGRAAVSGRSPKSAPGRAPSPSFSEQAVGAHAAHFASLAEREGPRLNGAGSADGGQAQLAAIRIWRVELDNILKALETALERGEVPWVLPIATYLQRYLEMSSGYFMQRDRYLNLVRLAAGLGDSALLAQCRLGLGSAQYRLRDFDTARTAVELALTAFREAGDVQGEAAALSKLASIGTRTADYACVPELHEQSLAISREIGDRWQEAYSLGNLALLHLDQCEFGKSAELQEQALMIRQEIGDRWGEALSLANLGSIYGTQGKLERAIESLDQALPIMREIGDRRVEALTLVLFGNIRHEQGDYTGAEELQGQALSIFREIGDRFGEAHSLNTLSLAYHDHGDYVRALELQNEALVICREIGNRRGETSTLANLANTLFAQGENAQVAKLHIQALTILRDIGDRIGLAESLAASGCLLAACNRLEPATVCLARVRQLAEQLGIQLSSAERRLMERGLEIIEQPRTGLPPDVREQVRSRADSMSLEVLTEFALAELGKLHADLLKDQS